MDKTEFSKLARVMMLERAVRMGHLSAALFTPLMPSKDLNADQYQKFLEIASLEELEYDVMSLATQKLIS